MKIVNIRDGFIKIESENRIAISSFLEIKSTDKSYIAQVIQQKESGAGISIYAKILFLYINGIIAAYDKTTPGLDSEIEEFPYEIVEKTFATKKSAIVGKFADDSNIRVDNSFFNNKFLVSADSPEMTNIVANNLLKQFSTNAKVIFIDTLGISEGLKYVAGRDFRLPINKESLKFIYEDCLKDATLDSKKTIKEIFSDLSSYSDTVEFVPFDVLKSIIDDMVDKEHIFKLMVLKNKLERFKKMGYFASNMQDAKNLNNILKSDYAIIDISKLDAVFQNRYLELLYSEIDKMNEKVKVIVTVSNNINKNNLKTIILNEYIASVFITHSKFKYLNEIKQFFNTFILENTYANRNLFNLYSLFFNAIKNDEYLIVGEGTNYIPLISKQFVYTPSLKTENEDENDLKDFVDEYQENFEEVISEKNQDESIEENKLEQSDAEMQSDDTEADDEAPEINLNMDNMFESTADEELEEDDDFAEEDDDDTILDESAERITNSEMTFETAIHTDNAENIVKEIPEYNSENSSENLVELNNDNLEVLQDNEVIYEEEIPVPDGLSEEVASISEIHEISDYNDDTALYEEVVENNDLIITDNNEFVNIEEEKTKEIEDYNEDDSDEGEIIAIDITEDGDDELSFIDESEVDIIDDIVLEEENLEKEIIEDVDKVFTEIKEESISESDLDFIDELNELDDIENLGDELAEISDSDSTLLVNDEEMFEMLDTDNEEDDDIELLSVPLEEYRGEEEKPKEILETKSATNNMVPVYEAEIPQEDKVISDPIEQGDAVVHAKYGTGIVEKMIKYGNKDLYSINFDNVGRRLLDPTLTEIKKA